MTTTQARVTINFSGRLSNALGVTYNINTRRTITLNEPFTYMEAKEAARVALYKPEGDDPAYEHVMVNMVSFN